jgi:N-acetylneuraminic acid mutarotase
VVARLPQPLRYAAVASLGKTLYIAGGSTPAGASRDVYAFDPATRSVSVAARLPRPTTHAAAAALGCCVYVLGGRSAQVGTPTSRIVEVRPGSSRTRSAGRLPTALSDLGAVTEGNRILAIGGRAVTGTVATVLALSPRR